LAAERPRQVSFGAIAGVAAAIAFWPTCSGQKITTTARNPDQASEDYVKSTQVRIAKLKQRIAEEKAAAEDAVNRYAPAAPGKIDDLTTPAADLLRGLPFVSRVDVAQRVRRPIQQFPAQHTFDDAAECNSVPFSLA
jgi:hypothetical protein